MTGNAATKRWGRFVGRLCLLAALVAATPAGARDIKLGGTAKDNARPAPNIVELPSVVVLLRRDDGGWHHIQIDAWLAPEDLKTARKLDGMKTVVVQKIREALPGPGGFETLQSAHEGNQAAKEVIHEAVGASLGQDWSGDVLIRDMLVY